MAGGERLRRVSGSFLARTVMVVGDVICDEYLIGKPARISREAPVIILKFTDRDVRLGGAANAANNVHALGARVIPIGVVGADRAGDEVLALFQAGGISTDGIVVDRGPPAELSPVTEDALLERLSAVASRVDGILVSDYVYGTVSPRMFEGVRAMARATGAIVTVDSRYDLPRFPGITAATPNEAELGGLTGQPVDDERSVEKAGRQLLERLDARLLLVTRGSQGIALLEREGGSTFVPIFGTDEIADVTGAGDTVIGTFTLALASGAAPVDAATLANVAGGIVVMKRGTATVTREELIQALGTSDRP